MRKKMLRNWKILVVFLGFLIIVTIFYDVALSGLIQSYFPFNDRLENRRDLIALLQLLVTSFLSLLTASMALLTYRLQRQNNRIMIEKNSEVKLKKVNNILYYLEDTVKKLSNINFKNDELSNIFKSSREYRGDLNFLRQSLLNEDEVDYIKNIFDYVDDFSNYMHADDKDRMFKVKPLYKLIFDLYIPPVDIKKSKAKGDLDYVVSLKLLSIYLKLRMYLTTEYLDEDEIILPRLKNDNMTVEYRGKDILIKKRYDDKHYLHFFRSRESGFARKYEPVFNARGNTGITITYEQIYEGEIRYSRFNGTGRYDYYTKENGFKDRINSCELETEGLNFDANAQLLCKILNKHAIPLYVRVYFEGEFKAGLMKRGTVYYKAGNDARYHMLSKLDGK